MDAVDDVLVLGGILWLVVRQFQWRDAARMPRIGAWLLGIGAVLLVQEALTTRERWTVLDAQVLGGELLLTAGLGALMAGRYRARTTADRVLVRLERSGVVLWAAFVLVRLASFGAAHALGARAVESSGALLVVFGANRLVTGLLVRRRTASAGVLPACGG